MRRIPTLDGWRAAAILCVLWHHTMMSFYADEDAYYLTLARLGAFGVDVFFGLSGLLITGLLLRQWRESGAVSLKAFYTRRVFRIFPVYFLFLGVVAAVGLMHGTGEFTSCLLFFRNYHPNGWQWRNTDHLWSLSVEEHFYLIWPGLLVVCGMRRARTAAAWIAMGVGLWRMVEPQLDLHLFPGVSPHLRTDLRLDALLWGAVTAFTLDDAKTREKLRAQLGFLPWAGMVAVALFAIVYYSNLTSMFLAVLIPMILAGTLLHPEWTISRLLDCAPIAWIGRISYSLYIWQQLFLVPGWEHPSHSWTLWPLNLACAFIVACASYYLVETPLLRVGGRLAARFIAPPVDPVPLTAEPLESFTPS